MPPDASAPPAGTAGRQPRQHRCRNRADQRATVKAISRATRYATQHGVVVVAAAGNEPPTWPTRRPTSSASTSTRRGGHLGCRHQRVVLAAELPGVATVSGVGPQGILALDSNFGNAFDGSGLVDALAAGQR